MGRELGSHGLALGGSDGHDLKRLMGWASLPKSQVDEVGFFKNLAERYEALLGLRNGTVQGKKGHGSAQLGIVCPRAP